MLASLISWSFSLIFSGLLAREVARRVKGSDYRAIGAAAYLGVGSVWALGLSSSAALIMAAPASLPDADRKDQRCHPTRRDPRTLAKHGNRRCPDPRVDGDLLLLGAIGCRRTDMTQMGVTYQPATQNVGKAETPGEWLEYSPVLTIIICTLGFLYLIREVATVGPSVILELNHYVFLFLIVGLLLHWRPRSFVQAIAAAVAPVGGVLIQYPLYAGIVRMMTESGIATQMAHFFVTISSQHTYPVMIGIYSAFLGLFIPSAGGKWLIEAPYMLDAAKTLQVHLGWVVQTYNATEALANLIHPVLDAATCRHPRPQSAGHRWLLDAAVRRARASRVVPRVGVELHTHVHASGNSLRRAG
jgi:short-chain fatty acids transporter